ncbi:MAG: S8 family serine peptidase [Bacteroidota bacterium]|nr:S8 family serine peptidase [Bacteroidota bacterium]
MALQRAFEGDAPIAPDVFVVNFSIGVRGGHFAGRISSLARLLDWWSYKTGVLFVVSAGNVQDDLTIRNTNSINFENFPISERQRLVRTAQRLQRHKRTLLSPSEALNVLTIGAASLDMDPSAMGVTPRTVEICQPGEILPAMSSAIGPGPFRCIKPDLIAIGGHHEITPLPGGNALRLRVVQETNRTGLTVAGVTQGNLSHSRSRGTSCAGALVTRSLVNAAAALTEEGGPYEGQELSRTDLALLTRALAVSGARLPETAETFYQSEYDRLQGHYYQAREEVARYFGYGFLRPELMCESPLNGATLVGLGSVQKDGGTIFNMPLPPSLSGDVINRSMLVTLTWFSPVEPTHAKYRLAALEAIATDGNLQEDEEKDDEWKLGMRPTPPSKALISRGTVWSRRFVHKRKKVSKFSHDATLPIRVQCRDASGLDPDVQIRFAMVVTLQLETPVLFDIHKEIGDRLLIRVPAQGQT